MRKEKLIIRGKHLPLTVGLTNKETLKKYSKKKNMKIYLAASLSPEFRQDMFNIITKLRNNGHLVQLIVNK